MVLVTTVWLLIIHTCRELRHCWNRNNVLVCLGDLPDKVLTVFQNNGKTIKIKNALRVQVVEHAVIFHMAQGYWNTDFHAFDWICDEIQEKLKIWIILLSVGTVFHEQKAGICNQLLYHHLGSVRLSFFSMSFYSLSKQLIHYIALLYFQSPHGILQKYKVSSSVHAVWIVNKNDLRWQSVSDFSRYFPFDDLVWLTSPLK